MRERRVGRNKIKPERSAEIVWTAVPPDDGQEMREESTEKRNAREIG